jgi:hypothetical protein
MITFMEKELELSLSVAVVSHNKLLKKILSPRELEDASVRKFICERNQDALKHRLGADHPLIGLMDQAPTEQAGYLKEHYPELTGHLNELAEWEATLKSKNVDYVYADMLALPNQSYYKGNLYTTLRRKPNGTRSIGRSIYKLFQSIRNGHQQLTEGKNDYYRAIKRQTA